MGTNQSRGYLEVGFLPNLLTLPEIFSDYPFSVQCPNALTQVSTFLSRCGEWMQLAVSLLHGTHPGLLRPFTPITSRYRNAIAARLFLSKLSYIKHNMRPFDNQM